MNERSPASALSQTKLGDVPLFAPAQDEQPALSTGTLLLNRFELAEEIGAGGMGRVYAAKDRLRDADVAIKVLGDHIARHEAAQKRFITEASISLKLAHPNIVRVYDIMQDQGRTFIVMELLSGRSLRQLMDSCKASNTPFEVAEAKRIALALLDALHVAHSVTVHRDIKPENIIVTAEGVVKLMDFGIARDLGQSHLTHTSMAVGTAYYMAPEQLSGTRSVDGRADLYALGVVLYEMLTGAVPAGMAQGVNALRPDVPRPLARAIEKALAQAPEQRFANAQEFKQAFESGKIAGDSWWVGRERKVKMAVAGACAALVIAVAAVAVSTLDQTWLQEQMPVFGETADKLRDQSMKLEAEVKDLNKTLDAVRNSAARDPDRAYAAMLTEHVLSAREWATLSSSMQVALLAVREKALRRSVRLLQDAKASHESAQQAVRALKPSLGLAARAREASQGAGMPLADAAATALAEIESGQVFNAITRRQTSQQGLARLQEIDGVLTAESARLSEVAKVRQAALDRDRKAQEAAAAAQRAAQAAIANEAATKEARRRDAAARAQAMLGQHQSKRLFEGGGGAQRSGQRPPAR